jgi:Universal stress protein family
MFGTGLVIAFAYEPPAMGAEMADHRHALMADHRHALEERGKALTAEALQLVAGTGVEATPVVIDARPADGLLALAAEHQARMIVIGTYGERPLLGVVLGSTPVQAPAPLPGAGAGGAGSRRRLSRRGRPPGRPAAGRRRPGKLCRGRHGLATARAEEWT